MSSLNGFNGQQAGRPAAARPTAEQTHGQQPQQARGQQAQAGFPNQWAQQAPHNGQGGYAQPAVAPPAYGSGPSATDPYAPQFEPFAAAPPAAPYRSAPPPQQAQPAYAPHVQQAYQHPQAAPAYGQPSPYPEHGYGAQAHAPQATHWGSQQPDPRGYDVGSYLPQSSAPQANANYRASELRNADPEPSLSDWTHAGHAQAGYQQHDPYAQGHGDIGFAQASGGEVDQGYAEDDGQEYEADEPVRGRRPLLIVAALAGAIFVGGGLAYGYKALLGGAGSGVPPVIKSASEPSRIKPADAGGKQFAHTDSKIMGRLGEGDAAPASASGDLDANGTRKVATVVIGRDGSIQAPAAAPADAPAAAANDIPAGPGGGLAVPGMTVVDAFGARGKNIASSIAAGTVDAPQKVAQAANIASQKLVVTPPPAAQKPVVIAKAAPAAPAQATLTPDATGSIDPQAAAPPPVKKIKKVAAANAGVAPASAPATNSVATAGSGFVAVLASIPKSGSSRMDALKKFADMQQKYGNVLGGKTPDVADANLGAKGDYHRLVVGPPASREQASTVCSQLKSQGYADCWVTSY